MLLTTSENLLELHGKFSDAPAKPIELTFQCEA
jgi:hypothetical protein